MAGTSSLLRSASARKAAIQNEKNRIIDMEWNLSAKTEADFAIYQAHYEDAAKSAKSSDKITFQNKIITANRSYRSKAIQQASIDVIEGRIDNETKQSLMIDLYNDAIDNEDLNQAQTLRLQIDNLQNTIIAEKAAMLNTAKQMADAGYKQVKAFATDLKNGNAPIMGGVSLNYMNELFRDLGPANLQPALDELGQRIGIPTPSFIDIAHYYAEQTLTNLEVAAQNLQPDEAAVIRNDINAYRNGSKKFDIPGMTGDMGITYDDLVRAKESQINGSSPIIASQNAADGRPGFTRVPLARWEVGKDANGNSIITAVYEQPEAKATITSNLNATDGSDNAQVKAYINGFEVESGRKLFRTPTGDIVDDKGRGVKIGGATFENVNLSPEEALAARGFRVNEGGTVDLPNAENVPQELRGMKNVGYQVDDNGNIQFAFDTKDAQGQVSRGLFTFDAKNNRFANAQEDILKAQENKAIFNREFGGSTMQSARIGDTLQAGKITRDVLQQDKLAQEAIQQSAKMQQNLQQAASAQALNTLPNQPLKVMNLPAVTRPLQVVNTPPPTTPLKVVNTPSNANVKVYKAPITQGTTQKVSVVNTIPSGTLRVR